MQQMQTEGKETMKLFKVSQEQAEILLQYHYYIDFFHTVEKQGQCYRRKR